jgi:hypothetical protein
MRFHQSSRSGAFHLQKILAGWAAQSFIAALYCALPLMPLLAAIAFLRWRFVRDYATTFKKMCVHLEAIRNGPVQHFFQDVLGRAPLVPQEIGGSCVQCGNCCLERRCAFLEQVAENKYQCGIYTSMWRRFSNCGSFPLNQYDIDRYACPSYYTIGGGAGSIPVPSRSARWVPVRFVSR